MKNLITFLLVCFSLVLFSQEPHFKNKQLINAQTTVIPGGLDFTIQHRFGAIGLDKTIYKDFLGFDQPANIRFSLSYKLTERLYVGLGRTKIGKTVDFEGKYLVINQDKEKKTPLSVALYFGTGINTEPDRIINNNMFFVEDGKPFENRFAHRLDYVAQIILSKSINDKLSIQASPTFIYKNLVVNSYDKNHTFVLPISGKFSYSYRSSILFEYGLKINNYSSTRIDNPFSLGLEFGTAGHVFQVFATNSYYIRESNVYTREAYDIYDNPLFSLGFNIRRVWWF